MDNPATSTPQVSDRTVGLSLVVKLHAVVMGKFLTAAVLKL
jgi:hypothetical protein